MQEFITPIVKCSKGKRNEVFYTIPEYESWKEDNNEGMGWTIKVGSAHPQRPTGVKPPCPISSTYLKGISHWLTWTDASSTLVFMWSFVQYYKGLGTSTAAEAKEYFSDLVTHRINFIWRVRLNYPHATLSPLE